MTRLNIPIITGSIMLIGLAFLLLIVMPERHFQVAAREERSSWHAMGKMMVDGFRAVRRSSLLLIILAITVFAAMSSEGFDRLNIAHFVHDYTFPVLGHLSSVTWFGIIQAGAMLLTLLVTEIVRRHVDTRKQHALVIAMFACQLGLIIGLAGFALSGNFYVALLAYWIARTCRNADTPLYNVWLVQNSDPRIRATIVSMFGQVDAIGQIAGGPGIGLIGSLISLRAALLATCAILCPNVFFFTRALQLSKRRPLEVEKEDTCNFRLCSERVVVERLTV
jgi:DHA3 family tetracycline resistance protein-like MFS transporter